MIVFVKLTLACIASIVSLFSLREFKRDVFSFEKNEKNDPMHGKGGPQILLKKRPQIFYS